MVMPTVGPLSKHGVAEDSGAGEVILLTWLFSGCDVAICWWALTWGTNVYVRCSDFRVSISMYLPDLFVPDFNFPPSRFLLDSEAI